MTDSHRCSICNKVDNMSIETEIGDYDGATHFVSDPKDESQFICGDCEEEIKEVRDYFEWKDEQNSIK